MHRCGCLQLLPVAASYKALSRHGGPSSMAGGLAAYHDNYVICSPQLHRTTGSIVHTIGFNMHVFNPRSEDASQTMCTAARHIHPHLPLIPMKLTITPLQSLEYCLAIG